MSSVYTILTSTTLESNMSLPSLVLTIDGLQPEKGHETLYVVRELMGKRVWFAEPLLSSATQEARNEHSCHSRQSSVFPLSGCVINQGLVRHCPYPLHNNPLLGGSQWPTR